MIHTNVVLTGTFLNNDLREDSLLVDFEEGFPGVSPDGLPCFRFSLLSNISIDKI